MEPRPGGASFDGLPLEGRVEPDVVTLFRGWSRLTTLPTGEAPGGPLQGFCVGGTQYVRSYTLRVDGRPLRHTFGTMLANNVWSGVFLVPGSGEKGDLPEGRIPRGSLEVCVRRAVEGGWVEAVALRNNAVESRRAVLEIDLECPIGEVENEHELDHEAQSPDSPVTPRLLDGRSTPALRYDRSFGPRRRAPTGELRGLLGDRAPVDGLEVTRGLVVETAFDTSGPARLDVRPGPTTTLTLEVELPPKGSAELVLRFIPEIDGEALRMPSGPLPSPSPRAAERPVRVVTGEPVLDLMFQRAAGDLAAMRLPVPLLGDGGGAGSISAGVPRFVELWCRDALTATWQASPFGVELLDETLERLGRLRGVRHDPWRDEEPDKIARMAGLKPRSATGQDPNEIYYGDVATTSFWVVGLATAYNWTGDKRLLDRHAPALEACCRWIERKLEEGRGFIYYATESPAGVRHHGWKDSPDAIVDAEGRIRLPPLAAAEIQGYAFLALLLAAQLALAKRRRGLARRLYRRAMDLKKRFNAEFWMPEKRYFAVALDAERRPVDSITSNPGHCLGCGIVDRDKAPFVARRLLSDDMFSGWGIRTLSSDNPAYDPFSYHRGSVWPVENATIAAGLRLTGAEEEAARLVDAQLRSARMFPGLRLPEVLSGHARSDDRPVPGLYPHSNLLQAWSSSAVLFYVWVLLGLRPLAPLRTLLIKPLLPESVPWLELHDLRVGKARVSLRFWRTARGRTRWKTIAKEGLLWVVEQPLELSPEATVGARLRDLLRSAI